MDIEMPIMNGYDATFEVKIFSKNYKIKQYLAN
jgi:hypothetical protein